MKSTKTIYKHNGFTIVELLIVIIVIGVLAALVMVAYNGISKRAVGAQIQSSLRNATVAMENDKSINGSYPLTLPISFKQSSGSTITYVSGDGLSYCLDGIGTSNAAITYFVNTQLSKTPQVGTCANGPTGSSDLNLSTGVMANLRVRLEAKNISQSDNTAVTTWADTSGAGRNAIASNSPIFRDQAGLKYIEANNNNSLTTSALGISGAAPRHVLAVVNTTGGFGTMMGMGSEVVSGAFDLWHYNDSQLIWHGYGGGFDTLGNAPAMSSNAWHTVEAWYDGTTVGIRVDGGNNYTKAADINTTNSGMMIGKGNWQNSWSGRVRSVLVFNQKLTDADAQTVRAYLNQ